MRKLLTFLGVLSLTVASMGGALAAPRLATVTILHGLPKLTADVYVNGKLTLDGFEPESATKPLSLPAGKYHIEIRSVGAAPDSPPALEGTATIEAGQNLSIIAGLTDSGDPTLKVFANDMSRVPAGKTRLVVRHVAAAPEYDVLLDGTPVLGGIASGDEANAEVSAGNHSLRIVETGVAKAAIGPTNVSLKEGTEQILYVVGSAKDQSLDLMTQTVSDLQSRVPDILTGDGGLAATSGVPVYAVVLLVMSGLGIMLSGASLLRRRLASDRSPTNSPRERR